jgi:ATP-dependent Clp protease adaptor protein ClpS
MSSPATPQGPAGGTATTTREAERQEVDLGWVTLVWDDPVNLMTYFGYNQAKAGTLMLQVHNDGRAVVSSGTREQMETDVDAMHSYGLWATLEKA